MLIDGFLGIFLHARVDGGIDAQAVGIDVIALAVAFLVFVAPAEEGVVHPCHRVDFILAVVPRGIVLHLGLHGHHVLPDELAEIHGHAVLVGAAVEVEHQGLHAGRVVVGPRDVAGVVHLPQHHVSALLATLFVAHGIIVRGVLTHAYEGGTFGKVQVLRLLAEISVGGRLDAHGVVQEVEVVQIHGDDFLLGEVALQLDGNYPLDGFLQEALHGALGLFREQLLGQLLGDGTAAAGTRLTHQAALHDGTPQGLEVYARMFVETFVLCGHQGTHQVGRQLVVVHDDAVLAV